MLYSTDIYSMIKQKQSMTNAHEIGRKILFLSFPSIPFHHNSDNFQFFLFYFVAIISILGSSSVSEGLKWLLKRRGRYLKKIKNIF